MATAFWKQRYGSSMHDQKERATTSLDVWVAAAFLSAFSSSSNAANAYRILNYWGIS